MVEETINRTQWTVEDTELGWLAQLNACWSCIFTDLHFPGRSTLHSGIEEEADEASPRTLVKPLRLVCGGGKVALQLCVLSLLQNQGRRTLLHLLPFYQQTWMHRSPSREHSSLFMVLVWLLETSK